MKTRAAAAIFGIAVWLPAALSEETPPGATALTDGAAVSGLTPAMTVGAVLFAIIAAAVLYGIGHRRRKREKEKNMQLEAALMLAEQASAAKGDFMSRMSHEIRTPLNALIGYNTIAKNAVAEANTDEARRQAYLSVADCLEKSELASRHLLTVINDVLDMSAIESGKIKVAHERFDFKSLVSSLTVMFYSQAKAKDVDFEVLFGTATEEWFMGDQTRVSQILTNLLSNAVKFTPRGGSVKMEIRGDNADGAHTNFCFIVSDTGIGMDPAFLENIWQPFEQADASISRRFGGTGLGLAITKNLVSLMGGEITVKSAPGAGTVFTVKLSMERTPQPPKDQTCDFSGINALIVDDDVGTCQYITQLFSRCGAMSHAVTSGEQALACLKDAMESGRHFTMCMIDWRMPGMDGMETVRRMREIAGDALPLIIVTAYDYSEIADRVRSAGVSMFVTKPLFQSSLFDLLANVSGKKAPEKPREASEPNFKGMRLLLAEDNKMNMEVARTILSRAGFVVDSAWNGKEAVALFESAPEGTYQAILMDVHMPEMDGHEAARAIRASSHPEAKRIPIIAMTADAFQENVTEAYEAGMNGHISKPIDIRALMDTLKKFTS